MAIDPKQPVRVKKTITTPGGNVYPARETPYSPGEVPSDFLNDEFCTQQGVEFRPLPDTSTTTNLTAEPVNKQVLSQGELVEKNATPKLNINFASPEKIADFIDGAGPKTVKALDDCRKEEPFKSIEDLEDRCPLPKASGKTWEEYSNAIEF